MKKVDEERLVKATEYFCELLTFDDVFKRYGIVVEKHPTSEGFAMSCIFHEDYDPSCRVNEELKFYKCFACAGKKGGNIIKFMVEYERIILHRNITYVEMINRLISEEPRHALALGFINVYKLEETSPKELVNFKVNRFNSKEVDSKITLSSLSRTLEKLKDKQQIIDTIDLLQKDYNLDYIMDKIIPRRPEDDGIQINAVFNETRRNLFTRLGGNSND